MTCAHVLDLIDAGPFAVHSAAHLAAARAHARNCATCGPALAALRQIEPELKALGDQSGAPDVRMAVLARIEGIPRVEARPLERETASPARQPWLAWAGAFGAVAAVVATPWTGSALVDTLAPRTGTFTASLVGLPPAGPAALVVALGLFLYAKGLFSLAATAAPARRAGDVDRD
ncbi:MAG TPA: hypothetical protein VFK57_16890 [Vicinamibacterales bacterium]|nr:hypothetical protein [Vicinamibacterales bacterium]